MRNDDRRPAAADQQVRVEIARDERCRLLRIVLAKHQ